MQRTLHSFNWIFGPAIVFILLYSGSSHANLIVNSGFETGDFQNWTNGGFSFVEPCPIDYLGVPEGVPCAVDGGNFHTAIGLFFNTVDNGSIEQTIVLPGPGVYEFGATVSFGYVAASGDPIEGNYDTGSVSLSIPSTTQVATVEFIPNDNLSLFNELPSTAPGLRLQTDWFEMKGTFQYDGSEAVSALLNFNLQDAASPDNRFLTHFLIDNAFVRVVPVEPPVRLVEIDIKPYEQINNINPRSRGLLPVAVLTSGDFDALLVDPATVRFGPAGAIDTHGRAHVKDIDNDGDMDLLFHFSTRETGISCGDTEATLTGQTWDGTLISGTDSVNTVSCR